MASIFSSSGASSATAPWTAQQPFIKQTFGAAQKLYNSGAGFNAPTFNTVTPFSTQTKGALQGIMNVAKQGDPLAGESMGALSGILNSGGGINTEGDLRGLLAHSGNDAFAQNVQNQSDLLAGDVQRQFSDMGRYGSAADTGALTQQLGDYRTKAMADNWNQNIANQRGILGDISNVQQGNVSNQMGAVAAAPGAYEQQYAPLQHMAQVGAANDDLATRQLQAKIDRFNTTQSAGWNRLGAFSNMVGGPGTGSQATSTAAKNPAGGLLGGALTGAQIGSMIPGLGTLAGGLVGGGAGLLSNLFG